MLHWNLYAPSAGGGNAEEGRIGLSQWLEINRGLEADGSDVPAHVLHRTYHTVRSGFVPQLTIRVSAAKSLAGGDPNAADFKGSLVRDSSSIESWGWIIGHNFMNLLSSGGINTKSSQVLGIFSESLTGSVSNGMSRKSSFDALSSRGGCLSSRGPGRPALSNHDSRHTALDRVWISLCYTVLFFSSSPAQDEAPYAFIHLGKVLVERSLSSSSTLTLVANEVGIEDEAGEGKKKAPSKVVVVFLLPDGRWQEFELHRLDIQLASETMLEKWIDQLRSVCGDVFLTSPALDEFV
jgi:hypothetical protein